MRAIVFGGSGFVGSHLADALSEAGHEVTVFDLTPSSYLRPGQRFIEGDILDVDSVRRAVAGQDILYNFAGLADIDAALARPVDTVRLNILGCVNALEASRHSGIKRFVFASTIYVYSEAGGFYRVSKQACESYIEEYQRRFGLNYTILRYGTLYGRRANTRNSVYRYLTQALKDRRITVRGTGDEMREYIHVEDASRAGVQILADEFENQNVILTGHHPMRFRDLLNLIREIVGEDVKIELLAPPADHYSGHYNLTPYTFRPKIGKKLVSNYYLDMGQGLLDCLDEIHLWGGGQKHP
jgi:UDP-glucose 4-epimerase